MRSLSTLALLAVSLLLLAGCTAPTTITATSSAASTSPATSAATSASSSTSSAVAASPNPFPGPSHSASVFGSGSTFVKPLMEAWATSFPNSKVSVSYGGGGSGKGRKDITNKDVVFAGSDAPMSPAEMAAAPGILTFPESLGPIGVVYNIDGVSNGLHLDGETIGQILTGKIGWWDDAAIGALNSGLTLPHVSISVVVRSDSSGTTFAYTDFLSRASPTWASVFGSSALSAPDWTKSTANVIRDSGNPGVGGTTKTTKNSIGYVDLAFVNSIGLNSAAVKNQNGEYLQPTANGAAKAAASAGTLPAPDGDWSHVSIANAPGAGSYPISTFTYLLAYKQASAYGSKASADQVAAFKQFAWWVLHDGQQYATPIGYAPLPASVVAVGESALNSMS
jgi:phosphate transport system substrate-binding protein